MKEHELEYWTGIQHPGGRKSKAAKQAREIAMAHGSNKVSHGYVPEDNTSNTGFRFSDKPSHKKAESALRKAGYDIEGKDY